MSTHDIEALRALVTRFAGRRILVLGDLMLDRYLWGRVDRISPEAPVPVVEVERESCALGGSGNVAANLRSLGAEPVLVAVVGHDDDGARVLETLAKHGVGTRGVARDRSRPTTVKTRVIAHAQQVVRADRETRADLAGESLAAVLARLDESVAGCEGVL